MTADTDGPAVGALPGPMGPGTMGRRLLLQVLLVVALLAIVLGTASTIAIHRVLLGQVDDQLDAVTVRQQHAPRPGGQPPPGISIPGQPIGTLVLQIPRTGPMTGAVLVETADHRPGITPVSDDVAARAAGAATVGQHVTVTLTGLGQYRLASRADAEGRVIIGIPLDSINSTIRMMVLLELAITLLALAAAAVATRALVVRSLRPLHRLAHVSREVAATPLHTGRVELGRVPAPGRGVGSEVAELSTTVNAMLSHVERALVARETSESRVRTFVADASHELRNPLAAIRGYAELTRRERDTLPDHTAFALTRIEAESARMSDLVDDLLLLARLDAGRDLEVGEVDLSALAVNAVSDARAAGPDQHWRLTLPGSGPVVVPGDQQRLHQVLANLLSNARTHTPAGTVVEVEVGAPTGREAVVVVRDDGPGIAPDLQDQVFERFMRADAGRSHAGGTASTGLGLAIVAAIAQAHDGSVSVTSRPGRTEFTLRLPYGVTHR